MAALWSVKDAFGYFGAIPANIQWSWSARSLDGKVVAVNWWKDEIARDNSGRLVYDMRNHPLLPEWSGRHGNRDRIRNLAWARDNCDGLFRVVWCKASDPASRVRKTIERYPDGNLWMRLRSLNESTGEFYAVEEK